MLYVETTQKARDAFGIGGDEFQPPPESTTPLGNWMLNVAPIGSRSAFLFMNNRSLLNFPIMIGKLQPTIEDIPAFMEHGLKLLLQEMEPPKRQAEMLIKELDTIALCKAVDKSKIAVFTAIAGDYAHRIQGRGGLNKVDIGAIIMGINSTPRKTLGFKTPFEATIELLNSTGA